MKKTFLIFLFTLGIIPMLSAQSEKEVFVADEIVWYGLDFSYARLVGSAGFTDPQDIQNRLFDSWNQLIVIEADKYDLKKTFNKKEVIVDLTITEKRNAKVDAKELVINKDYTIEGDQVKKIIKEYKTEQKSGVGLAFVVESFDKLKETGSVYVTFFDIATKKVLLMERISAKPRGFGVRNYWAGSIHGILKDCEANYKRWEKKGS